MVKAVSAGTLEIEFVTNLMRLEGELNQIKGALGQTYAAAVREHNRAEQAAEKYAASLEKEAAAIGKTADQIKKMEIAAHAANAEAAGFTGLAQRIRAAGSTLESAGGGVVRSTGAVRAGAMQLSMNMNDVATSISGGAKPMQVFAQQAGQVVQAIGLMSGQSKGLIGFLGGPWGLALTSAVVLLAPFVAKLWEGANSAAAMKKAAEELADAEKDLDQITGHGLKTQQQKIIYDAAIIQSQLNRAKATREATRAELEQALAQAQRANEGAQGGRALNYGANSTVINAVADVTRLQKALADNNKAIGETEQRLRAAGRPALLAQIVGMTDKNAAATKQLTDKQILLNQAYDKGKVGDAEYVRQGLDLQRKIDAIANSDKNAAAAKRDHNKEVREAAKAARELKKAHEELQGTYDGLIAKFAPVMAAEQVYLKTLADIETVKKAGLMTDDQAAAARLAALQELIKKQREVADAGLGIEIKLNFDGLDKLTQPLEGVLGTTRSLRDEFVALGETADHALSGIADSFGRGGQAMSATLGTLIDYARRQEALDKAREKKVLEAGRNAALAAKAEKDYADQSKIAQIGAMGDVAAAAKGFFKERSAAYKALETAEKAFRAIEFALSVRSMVQSAAESAAKIFASAKTTAVKAVEAVVSAISSLPFPLNLAAGAATIAALASIGVAIAGSFGGGGSRQATNEGTGTVFGDNAAKSDSIKRSIDLLADLDTETLVFTRQMASSLKTIEGNIGGLTNLIIRTGGKDGLNASDGVATGFEKNLLGKTIKNLFDPLGIASQIPILGDILGGLSKILGGLFGTKTKVVGSGLFGGPQSLSDVGSLGFDASVFSDIKKTKKFFGVSTGSKYSTQFQDAPDELEAQFGKLLLSFGDAIKAAAGPLGIGVDAIEAKLNSFIVDIGKIDLQGLTGEEIQEKLTAVFGAEADEMAKFAIAGLEKFQGVGEGYFETLVRVASTVETVTTSLQRLGLSAESLGIDASMAIAGMFDSVADYADAAGRYFELFYSDAEQAAAKTAQLGQVFTSLGVAMPDSIAGFRALVEAQDLTTEGGQALYATLLQLAPAFADIVTAGQSAVSAAAILRERQDLERQVLEIQGDTVKIRAMELAQLDPSNRALQERIYALQDEATAADAAAKAAAERAAKQAAIANEREGLQRQWLELTGNTAALRKIELSKLDPSNRALQAQIWLLQDQQKAAQDAAAAAKQLADAWRGVGDSLLDEVKRIRGLSTSSAGTATLQSQFNAATIAARKGDMDAAKSLPELSRALLDAAGGSATSSVEIARLRGMTAASLEQTYKFTEQAAKAQDAAATAAEQSVTLALEQQNWWKSFSDQQAAQASNQEAANDALLTEVQGMRAQLAGIAADQRVGDATLANGIGRINKTLDAVTEGGDTLAVHIEGTVSTREAA